MKKRYIVGLVVAGFLALIGGIFAIVMYATSGITDTADEFFAAAREGDYAAAHALTSTSIRREADVDDTGEYIESNSLNLVVDSSWSNRSINNDRGTLIGSLETEDGGKIPATIELIYEGKKWKISAIELEDSGLTTTGANATREGQPGDATVEKLVKLNVEGWAESLQRDDFEYFAEFWMTGVPPEELRKGFGDKGFSDEELSEFKAATPVINDVQMRADGALMVEAEVRSGASAVRTGFQFAPIGEGELDWKIISLNVDRKK